jgi:hypothetical protein
MEEISLGALNLYSFRNTNGVIQWKRVKWREFLNQFSNYTLFKEDLTP